MGVPKGETKLKRILREKGIKQTFVAERIEMNIKTFCAIANGRIKLDLATAKKIADALGIKLEELA